LRSQKESAYFADRLSAAGKCPARKPGSSWVLRYELLHIQQKKIHPQISQMTQIFGTHRRLSAVSFLTTDDTDDSDEEPAAERLEFSRRNLRNLWMHSSHVFH
jgi:hypothetical protein